VWIYSLQVVPKLVGQFQKFDFVAGTICWCYQDYKSHQNLWPGHTEGYVDHGVVDEYRQRRPSFAVWEKRNRPVIFASEKWVYDGKGNHVSFEVSLSGRSLNEMPSYTLGDGMVRWKLRDRHGNLLVHGEQPVPDLRHTPLVQGDWAVGPSPNTPLADYISRRMKMRKVQPRSTHILWISAVSMLRT
jgi:beta-glucuronidase